jgi:hypothetical protein
MEIGGYFDVGLWNIYLLIEKFIHYINRDVIEFIFKCSIFNKQLNVFILESLMKWEILDKAIHSMLIYLDNK